MATTQEEMSVLLKANFTGESSRYELVIVAHNSRRYTHRARPCTEYSLCDRRESRSLVCAGTGELVLKFTVHGNPTPLDLSIIEASGPYSCFTASIALRLG